MLMRMPLTDMNQEELDEAIAKAMQDGPFIEFNGMNCNDWSGEKCLGWDGESRRCDCGNRRVSWEFYKDSSGTYVAYAEAY